MSKYLIATYTMRVELVELFPSQHINSYTIEVDGEPTSKAWEEYIQIKEKEGEAVIAISRLGERE